MSAARAGRRIGASIHPVASGQADTPRQRQAGPGKRGAVQRAAIGAGRIGRVVEDASLDAQGKLLHAEIAVFSRCNDQADKQLSFDRATGLVEIRTPERSERWRVLTDAPWAILPPSDAGGDLRVIAQPAPQGDVDPTQVGGDGDGWRGHGEHLLMCSTSSMRRRL